LTNTSARKGILDFASSDAFAIINADDRNGRIMVQNTKAKVKTFRLMGVADYKAKVLEMPSQIAVSIDGLMYCAVWPDI
jgi:UDP-N-acetylmuramoyl-L-alanyl-D-glutamate--2,6-diaminopimelate ligase